MSGTVLRAIMQGVKSEGLGSVDIGYEAALGRKNASHQACDADNNQLFSRSITQ